MNALRPFAVRHWDTLLLGGGALLFALAYVQIPLYYSNQNQYFLHAFAQAGIGELASDWLANTADPTPLFTLLATLTIRFASENLFYLYFAVLAGIYFVSTMAIVSVYVAKGPERRRRLIIAGAASIIVHSFLLRQWLFLLVDWDPFWLMNSGVAGQYILGPGLQPSVFGVLLLAAVAAFMHGRRFLAASLIIIGCSFHATYLLAGALLTIGFMADLVAARRPREALQLGVVTLVGVVPVLVYVFMFFSEGNSAVAITAQLILANDRLPHHALIERWLDTDALCILAWLVAGIWLAGRRWRLALAVPALLALGLSCLQYVTGNVSLALLFPWRLSAILVPVATAVLFGQGAARLPARRELIALMTVAVMIAASGVFVRDLYWNDSYHEAEPLMERIASELQPGQVFLIPVNLEQFRLATGAPVFIDRKSIPYRGGEVVEWRRRLTLARGWENGLSADAPRQMAAEGITHVVLEGEGYVPDGLRLLYRLAGYRVFAIAAQ